MTNKRIKLLIFSGFWLLSGVVLSTMSVNAQGRYVNVYSKNTVKGFIDRLERSSNTFRKDFDRYMDRSNLNGTETEDRYNDLVGDYEDALDRLRNQFNRQNSWWDNRENVQEMLSRAQPVNGMINNLPFSRNIESQWRNMRNDINKVADTFDLPDLNGGGWGGGGGSGGVTPPSWAQGNFSSSYPSINLTIDRNGRVTANRDGQSYSGTYFNGGFSMNGHNHVVTRRGNGIRTYNQSTNETVDYARGSGGGDGGESGGGSTPPSWAQGSFTSGNPQVDLTIDRNGRVTAYRGGQTYYGSYSGNSFMMNGHNHLVTRNGSGIRTYNQTTGENVDYRRR